MVRMASARIREKVKAKQAAARRSGVTKRPRRTLERKQLQLPTSPRTRANRRAHRGPVDHSPASRPTHVKTQSLVRHTRCVCASAEAWLTAAVPSAGTMIMHIHRILPTATTRPLLFCNLSEDPFLRFTTPVSHALVQASLMAASQPMPVPATTDASPFRMVPIQMDVAGDFHMIEVYKPQHAVRAGRVRL